MKKSFFILSLSLWATGAIYAQDLTTDNFISTETATEINQDSDSDSENPRGKKEKKSKEDFRKKDDRERPNGPRRHDRFEEDIKRDWEKGMRDARDSFADPIASRLQLMRTTPEIAKILEQDRPHEPHAIPVPKFVVVNPHNENFILTVGGQLNLVIGGDFGNNLYKQSTAGISFVTNAIPVPSVTGKKVDLYINAINGSANMQVVGFANTKNQVTGYFKIGTNGISTNIVLQRAYVTWRGITGGLKLTLFQDDYACQPPTIDPEGPSGEVSALVYELSYRSKSYNGWRFAAALGMPTYYSSMGYYRGVDYPEKVNSMVSDMTFDQYMPDIPAWVEYSWSQWNRIRVSGILRGFRYKNLVDDHLRMSVGWGAMLSGNIQPGKKWILYYQFAYGKGIGNYIQDIAGHPYSFIDDNKKPGKVTPSPMYGLNFGVTFNPTDKWQINAMASQARIFDVAKYAVSQDLSENYKYANYVAANCFYTLNSFLQFGVEYLYGYRRPWGHKGAYDNRAQAQVSFSF